MLNSLHIIPSLLLYTYLLSVHDVDALLLAVLADRLSLQVVDGHLAVAIVQSQATDAGGLALAEVHDEFAGISWSVMHQEVTAEALHVACCCGVYQLAGGVQHEDVLHVACHLGLAQCGDEVDVGVARAAEGVGTKKRGRSIRKCSVPE